MVTDPGDYKLVTRGVRKTYGPVVALDGADVELREGEFLTLLGPSGSGKTTLLMAIAGLNDPDRGEIWIDGKLATWLPPFERDIGMVFQNYALFPHMTIYENVAFPLRMRKQGEAAIREAVRRVLDTVQLPGVEDRMPRELSGGQQQRIALARCFVYEPSIILMDEPLGALDKKLRDALQREVKHLHENLGITVLYVTHDQEEAMVMSDRICLMNDARIEQIGTPADLYFRPASVFAADFLGESNLLPATVAGTGGGEVVLTTGDGRTVRGRAAEGGRSRGAGQDHDPARERGLRPRRRPGAGQLGRGGAQGGAHERPDHPVLPRAPGRRRDGRHRAHRRRSGPSRDGRRRPLRMGGRAHRGAQGAPTEPAPRGMNPVRDVELEGRGS